MVNLDVTPDFTAAGPVISGESGPFTGSFPKALMDADTNNIAPRVGFAWRIKPGDDPARRLRHQLQLRLVCLDRAPALRPGAVRGDEQQPRHVRHAADVRGSVRQRPAGAKRRTTTASTRTTRSGGCRRSTPTSRRTCGRSGTSAPGTPRRAARTSTSCARRTAARRPPHSRRAAVPLADVGRRFDAARGDVPRVAPPGEGHRRRRHLHAGEVARRRVDDWRRRNHRRAGRSESRGGVGRCRASIDVISCRRTRNVELPFGPNRHWLTQPGIWQSMLRDWRFSDDLYVAIGHAVHAARHGGGQRCRARHQRHAARQLRNGADISVSDPTIDRFFNTTAFTIPRPARSAMPRAT